MANKKPKKPKTYQELKEVWYRKLESSGFTDIEENNRDLKRPGSHLYKYGNEITQSAKQQYYYMAYQFLHNYKFKTQREKIIWEYHVNGLSVRDISVIFKHAKLKPISKTHVGYILKPLIAEMKRMYLVGTK